MKLLPNSPLLQPVPLHTLTISTALRLHPEFTRAPVAFARRRGVVLADDVFLETSFKKDPKSEEKLAKVKANIHLVRHEAVRLLVERDADGDWVKCINLNPALLLYGDERHPLLDHDFLRSLSLLRRQVTPLLAEPADAGHIVPGLSDTGDPLAYWRSLRSELLLPGILRLCLHGLSHPATGPAQGSTKTRIQLGNNGDDCVIQFTEAKVERSGPGGSRGAAGVRVELLLKGPSLPPRFARLGTTALVRDHHRLISFPGSSVALVHQNVMSQLEGIYLPVPPEWSDKSLCKRVTHAKVFALLSSLTPTPLEKLRRIDEELRHPSTDTRERLDEAVPEALRWLTPAPVSTLFTSSVYSAQESGMATPADGRIDPQIAAAYGQ